MIKIDVSQLWEKEYVGSFAQQKTLDVNVFLNKDASFDDLLAKLQQGECDAFVFDFSKTPLQLPNEVSITAVSERFSPQYELLIPEKFYAEENFLPIKKNAVLAVSDYFLKNIFKDISTDYVFSSAIDENVAVLPAFYSEKKMIQKDFFKSFPLNVREFSPKAAQGVLAYITLKNDFDTRRALKKIHHSEVSACTNVERLFATMIGHDEVGAYCEKDKMDNYHFCAVVPYEGGFTPLKVSSSTTFGLAASAYQQFLSKR
jgi:porphobilinogen deaminase